MTTADLDLIKKTIATAINQKVTDLNQVMNIKIEISVSDDTINKIADLSKPAPNATP